ncbi:hypothetical protein [Methylomonas sp. HYX-M1]|uniref:hypothetical protein n=1 Tax=Methylomonas sp. HYX-M1 TaxID=3139307 RepID=UPI00345B532A
MNKKHIYWMLCLIVFIAIAFPIVSKSDQRAVFQSVNAQDMWDKSAVDLEFPDNAKVPLFLIRNETLFLNIQITQPRWMLYMEVHQIKWDEDKLQSLLKGNPELQRYLPIAVALDGGIKWIEAKTKVNK